MMGAACSTSETDSGTPPGSPGLHEAGGLVRLAGVPLVDFLPLPAGLLFRARLQEISVPSRIR